MLVRKNSSCAAIPEQRCGYLALPSPNIPVQRKCARPLLACCWRTALRNGQKITRYPASIYHVPYEQLTADPAACLAALSAWMALPARDLLGDIHPTTAIGTASLWQARQPIHTRSVGRWRHYAEHIPELAQLPEH